MQKGAILILFKGHSPMINYFTCAYSLHMCRHTDAFWHITGLIFSNFSNEYIIVMPVMWPLVKLFLLMLLFMWLS